MSGAQAALSEEARERWTLKQGLSTSALKWIALFFMTLDHIAAFGFEIPIVGRFYNPLRLVGRIAAPLFLFALVQGLRHTRSRPRFLLRLYLAGMGAGLFVTATDLFFGDIVGIITPGNIMFTFFYVALYAWAIEGVAKGVRERNWRDALLAALCCVLPLLAQPLRLELWELSRAVDSSAGMFLVHNLIDSFLPTLKSVDYGEGMVFLGVILYFAKTKWRQCGVFTVFCLVCIAGSMTGQFYYLGQDLSSFTMTFFDPFQCWMVLALPFMMLYNGQRGRGPKWFFYIYYPIHRYVISVVSAVVQAVM